MPLVNQVNQSRVLRTPAYYKIFGATLTANQELKDQTVSFENDVEVELLGLVGTQTGDYEIELIGPDGRSITNSRIRNANLVGTGQFPAPFPVELVIPARGTVKFHIKDLSGASNAVQLIAPARRRWVL